jgi:anti-sigma B factor antagonist
VVKLLPKHILDQSQIIQISRELKDLIDQGATRMVIDFSEVLYLSSGALGMLVTAKKQIEGKKGSVKLCSIKPLLMEIFTITRMDNIFSIYPAMDLAVSSFES